MPTFSRRRSLDRPQRSAMAAFARWCEHDVWDVMHQHFAGDPDMENILLDSTVVRAHPCAAGALKKRRPGIPSPRTQPRRVQHQNPCERRCFGQSFALSVDWWSATRHYPGRRFDCRLQIQASFEHTAEGKVNPFHVPEGLGYL